MGTLSASTRESRIVPNSVIACSERRFLMTTYLPLNTVTFSLGDSHVSRELGSCAMTLSCRKERCTHMSSCTAVRRQD
jgi:hypothetical protein